MGEVGTCAEGRGRTGDDERLDALVGLELVEGLGDLVAHLEGHRIPTTWVVQREGGNGIGDGNGDKTHGR